MAQQELAILREELKVASELSGVLSPAASQSLRRGISDELGSLIRSMGGNYKSVSSGATGFSEGTITNYLYGTGGKQSILSTVGLNSYDQLIERINKASEE